MNEKEKSFGSLGKSGIKPDLTRPDPDILEAFESPFENSDEHRRSTGVVHIEAPEFTCICPVTGQPDFGTILISYKPWRLCVESKSLKLYLGGFRQYGIFHESFVNLLSKTMVELLDPIWLKVEGRFNARGGISFRPVVKYKKASLTGR